MYAFLTYNLCQYIYVMLAPLMFLVVIWCINLDEDSDCSLDELENGVSLIDNLSWSPATKKNIGQLVFLRNSIFRILWVLFSVLLILIEYGFWAGTCFFQATSQFEVRSKKMKIFNHLNLKICIQKIKMTTLGRCSAT